MDKTVVLKLRCPKCNSPARAEVKERMYKFFIYICPRCQSNVVNYDNKTDILSDKYVETLSKKYKLQFSGRAIFPKTLKKKVKKPSTEIDKDKITDLRILLNTETDLDDLISKL